MSTREALVKRPDVPDEDIDDIIEIAARLQDTDLAEKPVASVDDVRKVAAELDIDPSYVDAAINSLKQRRADEAKAAAEAAAESSATRNRLGLAGVAVLAALGLGFVGVTGVTGVVAVSAASGMAEAQSVLRHAESNLEVVLDRQAALAPQLVALAGGGSAELSEKAAALKAAATIDAKLDASDALGLAMAQALGSLPPATDAATQQTRANLQHEVSGITNRITVERRRYDDARIAYDEASSGIGPAIARGVGLH